MRTSKDSRAEAIINNILRKHGMSGTQGRQPKADRELVTCAIIEGLKQEGYMR